MGIEKLVKDAKLTRNNVKEYCNDILENKINLSV